MRLKKIKFTNFNYSINKLGDIFNSKGYKMKHQKDNRGYHYVTFHFDGKIKSKKIHRIVAEEFIPNPENKPQVNHIDGDKNNNNINNLEWCTCSENIKHSYDMGLRTSPTKGKYGSLHHNSRPVICFNKDMEVIKEYISIIDAEKDTGIRHIAEVCKNKRKSAGGFFWKYKREVEK